MKKLITIILSIFLVVGAVSATELWEYGSHSERAEIALRAGIIADLSEYAYTDNLEQNLGILGYLEGNIPPQDILLGGASASSPLPQVIADFEDSLAAKITSSATSFTLVTGTSDDGNALSGWYGFTIDAGSSNREYIIATCTSTACTSAVRGVSTEDGQTEVTALKKSHRRGASVKITDFPNLAIISRILQGADGIPDKLYYDSVPTLTADVDVATKKYADDLAIAGSPDATTLVKGISEVATRAEIAAGTKLGGTSAYLFIPAFYATSTPYVATTSVVVTESDGKLSQLFIDLTEDFTFTGSTTLTDLTVTNDTILSGNLSMSSGQIATLTDAVFMTDGTTATSLATLIDGSDARGFHSHVTFASDITEKDLSDASTSQVIAHGLGAIPDYVRITVKFGATNGSTNESLGVYNGTSQDAIYIANNNAMVSGKTADIVAFIQTSSGNSQSGALSVDATNLTIAWTKVGGPTGNAIILWEAFIK